MLFRKLIVFCLAQVVLGVNRYVIDRRSCNTDEIFDMVKRATDWAISNANLVATTLKPIADGTVNEDQLDALIKGKLDLILGKSDYSMIANMWRKFNSMKDYTYYDVDVWSDQWIGQRDNKDFQIHCNVDYIVEDPSSVEPNIHWKDTVQNLPVTDDDDSLEFKNPESANIMAFTSAAFPTFGWSPSSPEVVTWNPKYVELIMRDDIRMDQARVDKAVSGNVVNRIKRGFRRLFKSDTPMDLFETPESTMLHEMTHLVNCGHASDVEGDKSYGWTNVERLSNNPLGGIYNAENIMSFGLAVDLNINYRVDVLTKGRLKRIT